MQIAERQSQALEIFSSPKVKFNFVIFCIILALLKVWLVHQDEIIARYMPHDQLWFIRAANQLINFNWVGPYDHMSLIRQPAYPLWIWLVSLSGFPLRLGTEFLYLVAAFVFVITLCKAGLPSWLSVVLYALIIFHPVSFIIHNEAFSESFYISILLFSLSGMILLLFQIQYKRVLLYSILSGIFLAILWNIREENFLIGLYLLVFAILNLVFRRKRKDGEQFWKHCAIIILIPVGCILTSSLILRSINYFNYGIFQTSEMSAPGFRSAMQALMRIRSEHPRRFVPVPKEARDLAYQVSPSFKALEQAMETGVGKDKVGFGCAANGVCDDISAAWFLWALRDAVTVTGQCRSANEYETYYWKIADEINAACKEGKIPCQGILTQSLGYLHPYPSTYLSHISESFLQVFYHFVAPIPIFVQKDDPLLVSPEVRKLFDDVAKRRSRQTKPLPPIIVKGWVVNPEDPVVSIFLRDKVGRILASTNQLTPRPDVSANLISHGLQNAPLNAGFQLELERATTQNPNVNLVFATQGGKEYSFDLFQNRNPSEPMYVIDSIENLNIPETLPGQIQKWIGISYGPLVFFLSLVAFLGLILMPLYSRDLSADGPLYLIAIFLAAVTLLRLFLFALYGASALPISQEYIRYIYPVMPLYTCLILLITYQGIGGSLRMGKRFWTRNWP